MKRLFTSCTILASLFFTSCAVQRTAPSERRMVLNTYKVKPDAYAAAYSEMHNRAVKFVLYNRNGQKVENGLESLSRVKSITPQIRALAASQQLEVNEKEQLSSSLNIINGLPVDAVMNGNNDYYLVAYWFKSKSGCDEIVSACAATALSNTKCSIKTIVVNMDQPAQNDASTDQLYVHY